MNPTPDHQPDPRDSGRPCRVCGRTIKFVRPRQGKAYFQHASTDGLRWFAEAKRRAGR